MYCYCIGRFTRRSGTAAFTPPTRDWITVALLLIPLLSTVTILAVLQMGMSGYISLFSETWSFISMWFSIHSTQFLLRSWSPCCPTRPKPSSYCYTGNPFRQASDVSQMTFVQLKPHILPTKRSKVACSFLPSCDQQGTDTSRSAVLLARRFTP
jgi:hypothetical protein